MATFGWCSADRLALAKLKINIKSLAAEARANRKEAAKLSGMEKWDCNQHRKTKLRREARVAQWLYCFARGFPRCRMEYNCRAICHYDLAAMSKRINGKSRSVGLDIDGFEEWLSEKAYIATA